MARKRNVIALILIVSACVSTQKGDDEWITLFNGTDLNDWIVKIHHHDAGVNFGNTFRAEGGLVLAGLGDGKSRPTGNMCSPGTEIVYNGQIYDGHCLNSSSRTFDKDKWVKAELIVHGDSAITHIIEGDTVLQYSKPTIGGGVVQGYDSTLWHPGRPLKSGFIALQSEGQPIDFRNIQLKILCEAQ